MKREEFKAWLGKDGRSTRLVSNTVSRAARVENVMKSVNPSFSFEKEYKKDKGESFMDKIENKGVSLPKGVDLPVGTTQMYCIAAAARSYFKFLSETKK